jgi:hypothetical protein
LAACWLIVSMTVPFTPDVVPRLSGSVGAHLHGAAWHPAQHRTIVRKKSLFFSERSRVTLFRK